MESFSFTGEMYVDPSLKTYKAFRLVRGVGRTLGPSSILRGFSAMKKGFRQGKSAGDLWQQGGMFVIDAGSQPGDQMLFAHRIRRPEIMRI
ncbi:MAG: peroxiredoxin-like family protein [Desulfobacterales bacterium]